VDSLNRYSGCTVDREEEEEVENHMPTFQEFVMVGHCVKKNLRFEF